MASAPPLGLNANPHSFGFAVGAVYRRKQDIHARLGGQTRSGVSISRTSPYVMLFTSQAGQQHGYHDFYDDDGSFHYFGHGQVGDMVMQGGNRAIRDHLKDGKELLVFIALGGGWHRFVGVFRYDGHYMRPNTPDRTGALRNALVFRLLPVFDDPEELAPPLLIPLFGEVAGTQRPSLVNTRTKQGLFRRRIAAVEHGCRLTGITDLRFLRASHIKPWVQSDDSERVSESNGLLLTPSADLLFDHGWVSFKDDGRLIVANRLPAPVSEKLGLNLTDGRLCGTFSSEQASFLAYHRDCVFDQREAQDGLMGRLFD